jgi:hypothetical protein
VVAVDVDDRQAEFILDRCKHVAPDLRIGMRVAGDHHDIGIDLTGKRETAIGPKRFRGMGPYAPQDEDRRSAQSWSKVHPGLMQFCAAILQADPRLLVKTILMRN